MTTLNVTIAQPRVSNPFGAFMCEYFICKIVRDNVAFIFSAEEMAEDSTPSAAWETIAKINVTRPYVMAGSVDEIEQDIINVIRREVVKSGVCTENKFGVLFAK